MAALGSCRWRDTLKEGGEITANNSFLYKGRSETPGLKIEAARFDLG